MKTRINYRILLAIAFVFILGMALTSCGSSSGSQTLYLQESVTGSGCSASTSATKAEWLDSKVKDVITSKEESIKIIMAYFYQESEKTNKPEAYTTVYDEAIVKISSGISKAEVLQIQQTYQEKILAITTSQTIVNPDVTYNSTSEKIVSKFNEFYTADKKFSFYKDAGQFIIENYINYNVVAGYSEKKKTKEEWLKNYHCATISNDATIYLNYLNNATECWSDTLAEDEKTEIVSILAGTSGSSCTNTNYVEKKAKFLKAIPESNNIYEIVAAFIVSAEERLKEAEPLVFHHASFGDFMKNFFNNLFVFPIGWLLYIISKLFGGYYIIGLFITTILVRTIGWPIYAKSNDMSLKMGLMQPELNSVQEKYATRKDPDSQRMMQMEQAQLYKKYGVGLGGCIMPLLQFPIFLSIYNAVQKLPYTVSIPNTIYTNNWANEVKPYVFGINLFEDRTGGKEPYQLIGVIVLIVLVVGTQFLANWLSQLQQKKTQAKTQEDVPAYRRQAYNQSKSSAGNSMKIMMYVMMAMMGMFVWTSKAGLGIYWLIGNLFSIFQMMVNNKTSAKRMEKLKNKRRI